MNGIIHTVIDYKPNKPGCDGIVLKPVSLTKLIYTHVMASFKMAFLLLISFGNNRWKLALGYNPACLHSQFNLHCPIQI